LRKNHRKIGKEGERTLRYSESKKRPSETERGGKEKGERGRMEKGKKEKD
jgi:hypothetical protein